ncbi:unnamed protein product [Arabidopsis lyrata]|nr:unnamed protein product [Arabidopsis lyrata]
MRCPTNVDGGHRCLDTCTGEEYVSILHVSNTKAYFA